MRNSDCEDSLRCTSDQCQDGTCRTEVRDDLCAAEAGGLCLPGDSDADADGCVYRACDRATCEETQRNPSVCEIGACEGDLCAGASTCGADEVCCGDGTCANCDDGNPCTDDICVPGGACEHPPVEGRLCNDEDPCTVNDICGAGGSCGGTTCTELGATLMCDPGRGCVGCLNDTDCPNSMTAWDPCTYGGVVGTPATCAGTQSRNVTTGTCSMDMCNFDEVPETRNCDRGAGSSVQCDSDSRTAYSVCDYTDGCDQNARQTRTLTIYRCDAATCSPQMSPESRNCTRTTTGDSCGSDVLGAWSSCAYDDFCDETGLRTRSITQRVCGGGTCNNQSGGSESEVGPCTQSRDGMECLAGNTCTSWGSCMGFSDICDESGTEERSCTDRTCGSDVCNVASARTENRNCTRSQGGTMCLPDVPGTPSACVPPSTTDCTGTITTPITVFACNSESCDGSAGTPGTMSCNISNGTMCGMVTTTAWSACVPGGANSCTGDQTRTRTEPLCDGSGTCDPNMTTPSRGCDVSASTSCGASGTRPTETCQQTGMSCVGTQDTEDFVNVCDGSGSCDEITTPASTVACNMPNGTSCTGGNVCDGDGDCD